MRGPKTESGTASGMTTAVTPPESGRPSDGWISASVLGTGRAVVRARVALENGGHLDAVQGR